MKTLSFDQAKAKAIITSMLKQIESKKINGLKFLNQLIKLTKSLSNLSLIELKLLEKSLQKIYAIAKQFHAVLIQNKLSKESFEVLMSLSSLQDSFKRLKASWL